MKKHYFILLTKETAFFFLIFTNEIIFYSAKLFVCAVNFKFYLIIFIFLNINTNQTSKDQYLNQEAVTYFGMSRTKRFWKYSVRPAISQLFYPLRMFLKILVTFFRPVFWRTFQNLICYKFAILKNKKFAQILEVGKFSSFVTSLSTLFHKWQTFYRKANTGNSHN